MPAPTTSNATTATTHFACGWVRKYPRRRWAKPRRSSAAFPRSSLPSDWRRGPFTSSSSSTCGGIFTGLATLLSSQKTSRALLSFAQRPHQRELGHVVQIQGLNVVVIRGGHRFLRLDYLQAAGDARSIAVARLFELFGGKLDLLLRHMHLIVRGLHVQQR